VNWFRYEVGLENEKRKKLNGQELIKNGQKRSKMGLKWVISRKNGWLVFRNVFECVG